jgi:putative Mg2+ transporter-C (MgtC) family protein
MDFLISDMLAIILAALFGSVIGIEREYRRKAAGLRTNVLICIGAAVFTIISRKMGASYEQSQTRIAAQVVTGVGFLGAGAIIRDRGGILGLTTAATIWLVASIGMACGAGYYKLGFGTTVIALAVLLGLSRVERWIIKTSKYPTPGVPEQHNNSDILPD